MLQLAIGSGRMVGINTEATTMQAYVDWLHARIAHAVEAGELWLLDRLAIERAWAAEQG